MSLRINHGDSDPAFGANVAADVVIDNDAMLVKVGEFISLVEVPVLL